MYVNADWFLILSVFLCFLPCLLFSLVETLLYVFCACVCVLMCICVWVFSSVGHQGAPRWCQGQCPGEDASTGPANNGGCCNLTTSMFVLLSVRFCWQWFLPSSARSGVSWSCSGRCTCSQELACERTGPCLPQKDTPLVSSVVLLIWGYLIVYHHLLLNLFAHCLLSLSLSVCLSVCLFVCLVPHLSLRPFPPSRSLPLSPPPSLSC